MPEPGISTSTTASAALIAERGTSFFSDVNDALTRVGGELRSPAFDQVARMQSTAVSLHVMDKIDQVAIQTAFPNDASEILGVLQEVQDVSDAFTHCGDFAEDALRAASTDYIKNSGIQQAGRELSDALGSADAMIDCVAGFATLFESAGIMDDALNLGDIPQISSRLDNIIRDLTDPNKLADILVNTSVIQGLISGMNNMCGDMMGALNGLIQKDVDAMQAALTKLAQWAAFAKLATSDPCALVNNNQMLSHIAEPVMADIVKLYEQATGQSVTPTDPIIDLGGILGGLASGVPTVPKFTQAAQEGLKSLSTVADSIPSGTEIAEVGEEYTADALTYIHGVGWVPKEDAVKTLTKEIKAGVNRFADTKETFIANAADKKYEAVARDKEAVAKVHKVGWCSGGVDNRNLERGSSTNRSQAECGETGGTWNEREMTENEVQIAGSIEAAMGSIAPTLSAVFGNIVGDAPPMSPSSAIADSGLPVIATKIRDAIADPTKLFGAPAVASKPLTKSPPAKSSPDANDPAPFLPLASASFAVAEAMPGTVKSMVGAAIAQASSLTAAAEYKSNLGGDVSDYHQSMEAIEHAMKTGDWSNVETCRCKPKPAVASSKEVGSCDFTALAFPDGYKLIEPSFYTATLQAKVDAAQASGSGEYVMGDDGNIYQSAEVVVMAKYGATKVDPYLPGKSVCEQYSGKWIEQQESSTGASGGSRSYDIDTARSKTVCENANGAWVCAKGTERSTSANKALESWGLYTNKKNVNTKSKVPSAKAFDAKKLPSLTFSALLGKNA